MSLTTFPEENCTDLNVCYFFLNFYIKKTNLSYDNE